MHAGVGSGAPTDANQLSSPWLAGFPAYGAGAVGLELRASGFKV